MDVSRTVLYKKIYTLYLMTPMSKNNIKKVHSLDTTKSLFKFLIFSSFSLFHNREVVSPSANDPIVFGWCIGSC